MKILKVRDLGSNSRGFTVSYIYCEACGEKNNALFSNCKNCNSKLNGEGTPQSEKALQQRKKFQRRKKVLYIARICYGFISLFVGVFISFSTNPRNQYHFNIVLIGFIFIIIGIISLIIGFLTLFDVISLEREDGSPR